MIATIFDVVPIPFEKSPNSAEFINFWLQLGLSHSLTSSDELTLKPFGFNCGLAEDLLKFAAINLNCFLSYLLLLIILLCLICTAVNRCRQ